MKFIPLIAASIVSAHLLAAQDPTSQEKFPSAQRDRNSPPRTQAEASASIRSSGKGILSTRDVKFIEESLRTGRREVALSKDAAQHSLRPEVQVLAERIAKDYENTNGALEAVARHTGLEVTPEKTAATPEPEGSQLDDAYLHEVAADTNAELAAFELASIGADNLELQELAGKFAATLRTHLDRAQALSQAK